MTSGNAIATHVTYKNDSTFEYTSTEDSSYKEVGKYKIDGNKLYEMYSDEEEWIINDILLLNSMTLSVQELEADGVTPTGQKYLIREWNKRFTHTKSEQHLKKLLCCSFP